MKKKVVNIWGTNFSSVALKKPQKVSASAIEASGEVESASFPVESKNDIFKKKLPSKKSNF